MRRTFFHRVLRAGAPPLFCPFYHAVCKKVPPHLQFLYTPRTPAAFERDIQSFLKYFHPVDPGDLLKGRNRDPHQMLLTFDDGLRSFKEEAWPILKRYGIRPILFVNPNYIDSPGMMYRYKASLLLSEAENHPAPKHPFFAGDPYRLLAITYPQRQLIDELAEEWGVDWSPYIERERPYLTREELQELESEGVYIGGHSMDHPYYREITLDEQVRQTQESLDWVQEKLNTSYRFFSFPFTDDQVQAALWEGLKVDASFGTQRIKTESWPNHYQRLPMEGNSRSANYILWSEHVKFQIKRWLGRHRAKHPGS